MKLVVCSVFDSAAQAFMRPMFVPARGLAVRAFRDEVNRNDPENSMYSHASDYELFEIGEFDDSTGRFVQLEELTSMVRGVDCKEA